MNIHTAKAGNKVTFARPKAGTRDDINKASILEKGTVYTIEKIERFSDRTKVYLQQFYKEDTQGNKEYLSFNSLHFKDVQED